MRVAVVDDDASVGQALGRLLRASGFEATIYGSAEEFLDSDGQATADCMVLDVHLGGISGFELRSRLEKRGVAPPVVFITAHEDPSYAERARAAGGHAFFRKPVAGSFLVKAVREAVADAPNHMVRQVEPNGGGKS